MHVRLIPVVFASLLGAVAGLAPQASAQECVSQLVLISGKTNCADALQMSTVASIKGPTGMQMIGDYDVDTSADGSSISWIGPPPDAVVVTAGGGASSAVYVYSGECSEDTVTTSDTSKMANEVQFCSDGEEVVFGYAECPLDELEEAALWNALKVQNEYGELVSNGLDVVFFKNPNSDSGGSTESDLPAVCCRDSDQCNLCDPTGTSTVVPSCFPDPDMTPEEALMVRNVASESRIHVNNSSVYCPDYLQVNIGGVTTCLFSR